MKKIFKIIEGLILPKTNKEITEPNEIINDSDLKAEYIDEEIIYNEIEGLDPLFTEAAHLVVIQQRASTSLLQRKLKLGYNRAGRIIDELERCEVIGKFDGSIARTVNFNSAEDLDVHLADLALLGLKEITEPNEEREKDDIDYEKEIIDFLTERIGEKFSVGDLYQVIDYTIISEDRIRSTANQLYFDKKISRDGNHRYYIEDQKEDKIEDIKSELNEYKDLLESGLITQEDYDKKKDELLGL